MKHDELLRLLNATTDAWVTLKALQDVGRISGKDVTINKLKELENILLYGESK